MSKIGKMSFLISGVFFIVMMAWRLIAGGWNDAMFVPLAITVVFFGIAVAKDAATMPEFFTMRTTKHGMNMGVLILIALTFVVTLNFLSVRYDKKFDFTSDHLNSLSDQSMKTLAGLKQNVDLVLLYRKEQQEDKVQREIRDIAGMYQSASNKISYHPYSALERPDLAQKYDFNSGSWGLFAVAGDRHIRVDQPTEEEITKTLVKMGREKKKVIYFTTGHGERETETRKPETVSDLKEDLSSAYDVKPLSIFQTGNKIPDDADIVAIVGPQQQFLEPELEALRAYARRGGNLLLALDPGMRQNLAGLTKTFGVEFKNDYVLDPRANIPGAGNIAALGTEFSKTSDITRDFKPGMMVVFLLASEVKKAPDAAPSLTVDEIVKTDAATASANALEQPVKLTGRGPFTLAVSVKGKLPASPDGKTPEGKEFSAVIYGDSDFIANTYYRNNLNRDLVMNSIASLSNDKELISIRPKSPKGTKLNLRTQDFVALILVFVAMVAGLFLSGGVLWWRRRTA